MEKEEIKGGATEFLLNFDALLKANETEELKSVSLRSVRSALEAEIGELHKKKEALEIQIKEDIVQCEKEIVTRKDNAEHNFEKERIRLAELSKKLEVLKVEQVKFEEDLRHRDSLLNERDRVLQERDAELRHKEVTLTLETEKNETHKQENSSESMRLKRLSQELEDKESGVRERHRGLDENWTQLKKKQVEMQKSEVSLETKIKENKEAAAKNIAEKAEIEAIRADLTKDQEQVNASLNILNKQKKDNQDKEDALKAMKIDLDFRIAQLKRENEKHSK